MLQTGTSNPTINDENSLAMFNSGYTHGQNLHRISEVSGLIDGYEAQQLMSDPMLEDTDLTNMGKILTHNLHLQDTFLSPRDQGYSETSHT